MPVIYWVLSVIPVSSLLNYVTLACDRFFESSKFTYMKLHKTMKKSIAMLAQMAGHIFKSENDEPTNSKYYIIQKWKQQLVMTDQNNPCLS